MRPPFRIFKVQSDRDLHFVEAMHTFDDAKRRVTELGETRPGEYVIDNEETGGQPIRDADSMNLYSV